MTQKPLLLCLFVFSFKPTFRPSIKAWAVRRGRGLAQTQSTYPMSTHFCIFNIYVCVYLCLHVTNVDINIRGYSFLSQQKRWGCLTVHRWAAGIVRVCVCVRVCVSCVWAVIEEEGWPLLFGITISVAVNVKLAPVCAHVCSTKSISNRKKNLYLHCLSTTSCQKEQGC